jgi:hypothetical protein
MMLLIWSGPGAALFFVALMMSFISSSVASSGSSSSVVLLKRLSMLLSTSSLKLLSKDASFGSLKIASCLFPNSSATILGSLVGIPLISMTGVFFSFGLLKLSMASSVFQSFVSLTL